MSGTERPRPGLRARYVAHVTAADVGARVSVRHTADADTDDPRPSDVVGRLLACDDDVLMVVDRAGQLHVVPHTAVLASRVVPPHPKLPPEPEGGSADAPLERHAARVLLLDADERVLLIAHDPGDGRRVWTAPGGGLKPGEDHRSAARRELNEEFGLALEPGPWVWSRRVTFAFRGVYLDQAERWFLARADAHDPGAAPLDDHGIDEARWFTLLELTDHDLIVAPRSLADHLAALLRDGPPPTPVDVGR